MMIDPTMILAAASLLGICVIAFAVLKAWEGWLAFKRHELERLEKSPREIEGNATLGAARIEVADLKERIKKLEAIASGVEL